MNKRILAIFIASSFLVLCVGNLSWAETKTTDDQWHFTLSPMFLWGISIDGTSQVGPATAPLELNFKDDVFENLAAVFTVHFEAQKNDLTIFSEYQYVNLDPSAETPIGPVAEIEIEDKSSTI